MADTSDQAYLTRHRRFEALEKRQRLREKEKIQHERYKLKERIEQLRSMPGHTFLRNQPVAPINAEQIVEGDRIRRELLREAEELERRYDLLLSTNHNHHVEEVRPPSLTIKVRLGSTGTRTPPIDGGNRPGGVSFASPSSHSGYYAHQGGSSVRNRAGRSSARPKGTSRSVSPDQRSNPYKRGRQFISDEPLTYAEIESQTPSGYVPDILRVAAPTNASRITGRTILPFGVKVPGMVDDQYDFQLPPEILPQYVSSPIMAALPEILEASTDEVGQSEDETLGLLAPASDE